MGKMTVYQIQELKKNTGLREILFVISDFDEVIGVSILKKTHLEKKICTFRIAENYQRQGIGTMLMKTSLEFLNTNKPIITVSSTKHAEFIPIFKRFNFCLKKVYFGKYRNLKIEYCYNGILLPETILKSQNIVVKDTNDMKTA